ncbi:MAG: glutathione S-transferase family protein [Myxococcota bacterium]
MKLYDSSAAPNPRRVRIFLAEKGIDIPTEQVDIGKRMNLEPDFLAKNPLGKVPVLELDDGTYLSETVAICRYLEGTHPTPPLMGVDPSDAAVVEMWQRRMEFEVANPIMQCFQNTHDYFKGRITQVPDYGEVCRATALERLAWIDQVLGEREFVAGERYSIADITLLVGIDFGRVVRLRIPPEHKNLTRWHEAVSSRPSAQA